MEKWIQKVHPRYGFLHRQLNIPKGEHIPTHLLHQIVATPIGGSVQGQTVTKLLKQRANFALNVRK